MKQCTGCGLTKPLEEYRRKAASPDGRTWRCKVCEAEQAKRHYEANKERVLKSQKQYYEANKELISERSKKYREANREAIAERVKGFRQVNREHVLARGKRYYEARKEIELAAQKRYREANKEQVAESKKRYVAENFEKVAAQKRRWYEANREALVSRAVDRRREKRRADPVLRMMDRMRRRFYSWFVERWTPKVASIPEAVGCSREELRKHIEEQFSPGMTWENYGWGVDRWNLDHVIPLAAAGDDVPAMLQLWHYSNLQPLWQTENFRKGARYEQEATP